MKKFRIAAAAIIAFAIFANTSTAFAASANLRIKATPEMFDRLDRNNDGALSKAELNKFRRAINS